MGKKGRRHFWLNINLDFNSKYKEVHITTKLFYFNFLKNNLVIYLITQT